MTGMRPGKEAMQAALATTAEYMKEAEVLIDARFGAGFAKANPALLGAFMQTAAVDFISLVIEESLCPNLRDGLSSIADSR